MFEEDISGLFVNDIDTGSDDFELSEEETDALEAVYDDLDEEFDEAINEVEEHCCHYHDDHHHHHHCDHHHCDHHHHDHDDHHDHEYDDEHDHEDYHHHHHCDECGGHYHDHDDEDDCSKHHCDHDHEDGHHEHHHHDGDYHHHYHDHDDEYEDDDDQTSEYGDDDDNEEDGPYYKKALYLLEERHRLLNKINAPNHYNISALHRNEAEERYRRELKEVERALDEINVKRVDQGYDEIDLDSAEEALSEYYDEAEEASSKTMAYKGIKEYKKAAKNNYLISQYRDAEVKHPNSNDEIRKSAAEDRDHFIHHANKQASFANKERKFIKDGAYDYRDDRVKKYVKERYDSTKDLNRTLGVERRESKKDIEYLNKRKTPIKNKDQEIKGYKAKESAFDFGETGLFTTLFTPAYEAAEDYDDDDLLMDEELDEEIKDEPNDMIIDNDEEYSDSEYDKDEELDEE